MRSELQARAALNKRSMTAEVVSILSKALKSNDALTTEALTDELRKTQLEVDATARQLHLLSDKRNRLKNMLSDMKAPVTKGQKIFSREHGDGTALSDAFLTGGGDWRFEVEWDADVNTMAPSEINVSEVERRGLITAYGELQTGYSRDD